MWDSAINPDRQYSVPAVGNIREPVSRQRDTEDLHAWSIYRQNLNSDFTDSALGSSERSPLPYGNFQLRESTVQTILNHPKYGPSGHQSELGSNMYTYLRFGLPRVFPPNKPGRDGSSGYDSSDDGTRGLQGTQRSKSIPNIYLKGEGGYGGHHQGHKHKENHRKLKASSEADLLVAPTETFQQVRERFTEWHGKHDKPNPSLSGARDSNIGSDQQRVTPIGHAAHNITEMERRSEFGGSKLGSHFSGLSDKHGGQSNISTAINVSREKLLLLNQEKTLLSDSVFGSAIPDSDRNVTSKHPHLQVRKLSFEIDRSPIWKRLCGMARIKQRLLDDISFEVRSGEILGILATKEKEGKTILDVLANQHSKWRTLTRGDFVINGLPITPSKLSDRITYARKDANFTPDISVRQTMLFVTLLQESGNSSRSFDTKGRINALIEDLGLSQVKHTRVRDLTFSEKKRLNVACHLLLDTDIVLLDQPTKDMDIFDTFFLIEYLKTWSAKGRIIILTIHPPTFEIFTMLSKVCLVSAGRMMYFGRRKQMLSYFAYIDYPCPAYKNPSDYYIDLVTLDNLSSEAMLESSQRVEGLADHFKHHQEDLSDPGPPSIAPAKTKKANFAVQVVALWIRVLIYMFPYNLIQLFQECILSGVMSILIGLIFWNVRSGIQQENVNDRFGFYYAMMAFGLWPHLLYTISKESKLKSVIMRDIDDHLYWRLTFILSKICYNFFSSGAIFLSYTIPAYAMAGLREEGGMPALGVYVGYMLLYLYTVQMVAVSAAHIFKSRFVAAGATGFVFTFIALSSGYPCHPNEISELLSWAQWVSPMKWMKGQLDIWEFSGEDPTIDRYFCSRNPLHNDGQIQVKSQCGVTSATHAFEYMGNDSANYDTHVSVLITLAFYLVFHILAIISFTCFGRSSKKVK